MKNLSRWRMEWWRWLGISLLLWAAFSASSPGLASQGITDLVRIDLDSTDNLADLAAAGVSVYARLYTQEGGLALLLGADPEQQARLRRLGFTSLVLDRDVRQTSYYLLYGLPESLARVGMQIHLLAVEGRQAVAALNPAQLDQLAALGVAAMPLYPQSLVLPQPHLQAATALPRVIQPDPLVQAMIDQVSDSVLYNYVGGLSGEWPVSINGSPFTLSTRFSQENTFIQKATRFAYERFNAMGLPVDYHYYSLYGAQKRNVYARQPGITQVDREFLITAHLDSYSSQSPDTFAPGADDNASGSAGVMAAADILKQYQFGCNLGYVLFTGEEQGLVGSAAFAYYLANQPETQVEAVLNLDMISYNTVNSLPSMELHVRTGNAADLQIANLFRDVVAAYNLNLAPVIIQPGNTFSDHASFWSFGIPAILAIEDWGDHTPNYHSGNDQLETLNIPYFTQFTKAAVATFAHMGCLLAEGVLRGSATNAVTGLPVAGAAVTARLDAVHVWSTTTQADGSYRLLVSPGSYEVETEAGSYLPYSAAGVVALRARETNLDILLQPCVELQDLSFNFSPILPSVGETVTFTASVPGFSPSEYHWDFGDGSLGSAQVVTHAYTARGPYSVTLAIDQLCTPGSVHHIVPVQLLSFFFPWAPVSTR